MSSTVYSDTGGHKGSIQHKRALLWFLFCAVLVALSAAPASAEKYIYKDKDGVYRSAEKEPGENTSRKPDARADVSGGGRGHEPVGERIKKFCSNAMALESTLLVSFYLDEAVAIRKDIYKSGLSGAERDSALEMLENCTKVLRERNSALKRKERSESARESSQRRQEKRFEKLVPLVKEKLRERKRNGITLARERFATPLDIEKMTYPLSYGMSTEEVRSRWGRPLWIDGQKGSQSERWRYPVGVALYFSYGKLQRWSTYKSCK